MTRRSGFRYSLILAALLGMFIVMAAASCDNDSGGVGPEKTTGLVISFEPNPVPAVGPAEWTHLVYVAESENVGIYIYGYNIRDFSGAGEEYGTTEMSSADFAENFFRCGGEGTYIPAGGTRCAEYTRTEGRNSGYSEWTFYGVDDLGNEVTVTARVDYL